MTQTQTQTQPQTRTKIYLSLAGLVTCMIGASLMLDPVGFEASLGVAMSRDVNVLNEVRSSGGALLAAGAVITIGAVRSDLTTVSLWTSILLFFSYGLSRFAGFTLDGMEGSVMLPTALLELGLGLASASILWARQRPSKRRQAQPLEPASSPPLPRRAELARASTSG